MNRRILESFGTAPGLTHVALLTRLPSRSSGISIRVHSDQDPALGWSRVTTVSREFFDVLNLRLIRGRTFTPLEEASFAPVVVISETVASTFWPGHAALGRRLWIQAGAGGSEGLEVVGVAADVHTDAYDPSGRRDIFLPFGFWPEPSVAVIARGDGPAQTAADVLRATAVRLEPPVGFLSLRTLDEELAGSVAAASLMGQVLTGLGLTGLFIAVGLYGITAQLAAQRRKELGIRKALGASDTALCTMLIRESAFTLLLGIVPGIILGQLAAWSLRHSFPSLEPFDWVALTLVPALLFLTGVCSALLPFRQVLRNSYAPLREL